MTDEILEQQRTWQAIPADDETALRSYAVGSLSLCAEAINVLSENLRRIGYTWVSSEKVPPKELRKNIDQIQQNTGLHIPEILTCFWELVGSVSFVDLKRYRHVGFWEKKGVPLRLGFADGVHIEACTKDWADFPCDDFEEWRENAGPDDADAYLLNLSPDGFHKDNISGGDSYGISLISSWKSLWNNFKWLGPSHPITILPGPLDFLSYLRTSILECAGFPALLGEPSFDSIREILLQGVPVF